MKLYLYESNYFIWFPAMMDLLVFVHRKNMNYMKSITTMETDSL